MSRRTLCQLHGRTQVLPWHVLPVWEQCASVLTNPLIITGALLQGRRGASLLSGSFRLFCTEERSLCCSPGCRCVLEVGLECVADIMGGFL